MKVLTITKHDSTVIRIVESEKAMTETLFNPIDGKHTADGYLLPPAKRLQRLMIGKQLYGVNIHGCLIKGHPQPDGQTRWQHQIDFTYSSCREFADQVTKSYDQKGRIFK